MPKRNVHPPDQLSGNGGDLYGRTRQAWKKFFELESERLRDRYARHLCSDDLAIDVSEGWAKTFSVTSTSSTKFAVKPFPS